MTNKELWDAQRREKQLRERSKTIGADLRKVGGIGTEAAAMIDWLLSRIASLQKDLNEEVREGQRSAGDAYAQGRLDSRDERDY